MNILGINFIVKVQGQHGRERNCIWDVMIVIDGHGEDLITNHVQTTLAAESGYLSQSFHRLSSCQ
ncbi:putative PLP-dependent transferase [Rosellinia necatrix]|uniref:Putative PLP-dependent transferase n=1 Tax=Rosellinia necatrix TaxID=77044 RepID=A0A1S8ABD4_ROSNE|nr:putative PLP-dependent transferase [Rosellinia necatrix]